MLLDQQRTFVGYNIDPEVLNAAKPDSVLKSASQVLSPKSDVSESGEVKAVATVFTDKTGALLTRKKASVWELPPRRYATRAMACHIIHFLSTLYEKTRFTRCAGSFI